MTPSPCLNDLAAASGRIRSPCAGLRAAGASPVTACDASPTLARLATAHCGLPVRVLRVQELDWHRHFDGIWACASLLHVSAPELPEVLRRLAVALKPGGILYASFKYGQGKREHGGRNFTDLDEAGLAALLRAVPSFTTLETWTTADRLPGREDERWLNTVLVTELQARQPGWGPSGTPAMTP